MEVYTKAEVDALLERIWQVVGPMQLDIADIKANMPDWVPLEEAAKLTGRSTAWFYHHKDKGSLPITFLPRSEANRRIMYSRADCLKYGRDHGIHPPVQFAWTVLVEKLTATTQDGSPK